MISLRTTSGYARGTAAAILLLIMALMLPASLAAQSFVYVNNQDTVNTVSGFSVAPTGALTPYRRFALCHRRRRLNRNLLWSGPHDREYGGQSFVRLEQR